MWKRILAWQMRSQANAGAPRLQSHLNATIDNDLLSPATLAAQKSGVAVQREWAKAIW